MTPDENPFEHITDQDALSPKKEEYFQFWASRTWQERLAEIYRLNLLKWGDEVFERGMDKSKIEVVDMITGKVTVIKNSR